MYNKIHILIADDDMDLTSSLSEQLVNENYDVEIASNGEETMARLQHKQFDVVILDLKMPKITGFEILPFIKKNFPLTKVVVLTGYADLKNVTECRKFGADEVIEKPYELGDLFEAIQYVLKK